jgi:WD40 repeat protein
MLKLISTQVSTHKLKLIPDDSPSLRAENPSEERSLTIDVTNLSDRFASFQVELTAEGIDASSVGKWYQVEPEICAKKPPGDCTQFKVTVTRAPIPAYETEVKLTAKILSVESDQLSTTETLFLKIEKPEKPLKIHLPFKELRVYPGDRLEIPAIIYNLSPKFTEITLKLSGLDSVRSDSSEKVVRLEGGSSTEVSFACTPPKIPALTSKIYDFSIEIADRLDNQLGESGRLEVMPFGIVEIKCPQPIQTIPRRFRLFGRQSRTAKFPLNLHNKTNQIQQVTLNSNEPKPISTKLQLQDEIILQPNVEKNAVLNVDRSRPWLGWKRKNFLEVELEVVNPESRKSSDGILVHPSTQVLELHSHPRIPFLLQVGVVALAGLWSVASLIASVPPAKHNAPVTSVRISKNDQVISASNDKTVRRWKLLSTNLLQRLKSTKSLALELDGEIAGDTISGKGIRVIRLSPSDNNITAVGKDNGEIELWQISPPKLKQRLFQSTDRVFDLTFVKDNEIFSVHGSGSIRWFKVGENRSVETRVSSAITAIAIKEDLILVGGQYNRFWSLKQEQKPQPIQYSWILNKVKPPPSVFTKNSYITSIAISGKNAVTSDNAGYITVWNLNDLKNHNPKILSQWQAGGQNHQSIRAIAVSENGCYVASAGNDGRLLLHWLNAKGEIRQTEEIEKFAAGIRAVDLKQNDDRVLIASDVAPHNEVKLYRKQVNHDCQ